MLKKLLKYDLLYTYKIIVIYYALSILFATLTRIFLSVDTSTIMNIIGQICSGVTITMMLNIIINTLIRNWVRFQTNFYKDESYLTHTLPITKTKHYTSKFLTSLITMLTSILVIVLTLFIAYYSKENMELLKNTLLSISEIYNSTLIKFITAIFLIVFLEMFVMLIIGYTGIILGNKKDNHKMLYTVISSLIIYFLTQGLLLALIFIYALFNNDIMDLFLTNELTNIKTLKTIIYLAIFIYSLFVIFYTSLNVKLFKKGINIE